MSLSRIKNPVWRRTIIVVSCLFVPFALIIFALIAAGQDFATNVGDLPGAVRQAWRGSNR
jgi:hypothetical protein